MNKGKCKKCYQRRSVVNRSLALALVLSIALLVGGVAGSTIAWLTAKTTPVNNVFTTSDINISLQEHEYDSTNDKLTDIETLTGVDDYKMVPGWTIPKDPWLTVEKGSEDCWVFIKVVETGGNITIGEGKDAKTYDFDDFIAYQIDTANWTSLDGVDGVYYTKYANRDDVNIDIKILAGGKYQHNDVTYTWEPNQVLTKPEVTKEMMNAVGTDNKPTLTFTAYASQYWKNNTEAFTAIQAWNNVNHATP